MTRIEEIATAITAGDYSHRVPELSAPHTEVGRLTTCINQMLGRIDTAFRARAEAEARIRRFSADASHELRTPLVGIKGYTDLYRMGAMPTREDVDQTMTRIAEESARLTRLVEEMFLLARLDEDTEGAATGGTRTARQLGSPPTSPPSALRRRRPPRRSGPGHHAPGGPDRTQRRKTRHRPGTADAARLRQVVTNLIGNAVAHTPPGTPIRIGVGAVGRHAVLEVADQGPGLTATERALVFDRFYRTDDSRTRATRRFRSRPSHRPRPRHREPSWLPDAADVAHPLEEED
ncbi:HAMP domain-containing sensor histidine kinase [Streptomyces sp. NPDC038707]|uniref:HAMP domain-containing sensor histidine kinase n=1 Tax=Streptomyces sp. NPDC038707 TaxID=3154329 RepID=UPI0033F0DE55